MPPTPRVAVRTPGKRLLSRFVVAGVALATLTTPLLSGTAIHAGSAHAGTREQYGAALSTRSGGTPAPRTAAGYAAMFARVPVSQWGGGDVTISTKLPDGRRVWLFGDTLSSRNGFVHSTAMVQKGGSLHVSRMGAQVLPNEASPTPGYSRIYWFETVRTLNAKTVRAQVAPMEVGTKSAWDFHRWTTKSRLADLKVDAAGNVRFSRWAGWSAPARIGGDGEDFKTVGPHHFTYQEFVHSIRLSDGNYLKTVNQNWDDAFDSHRLPDGSLRYTDWRPMFTESATRADPYFGH